MGKTDAFYVGMSKMAGFLDSMGRTAKNNPWATLGLGAGIGGYGKGYSSRADETGATYTGRATAAATVSSVAAAYFANRLLRKNLYDTNQAGSKIIRAIV
jgi:hypothetical protein